MNRLRRPAFALVVTAGLFAATGSASAATAHHGNTTYQDGAIGGNFTVRRLHTCWFGLIRVHVGGNALMVGGRFGDPDAMEIVTNVIDGNLGCFNNVPQAQVGDSQGAPNVVGGTRR